MELDQTGLSETDAASAANKNGKVIAKEDEDSSENDEELVEYNADDEEDIDAAILETQAQLRALERVALKEMLTNQQRPCVERNSQIRESENSLRIPILGREYNVY